MGLNHTRRREADFCREPALCDARWCSPSFSLHAPLRSRQQTADSAAACAILIWQPGSCLCRRHAAILRTSSKPAFNYVRFGFRMGQGPVYITSRHNSGRIRIQIAKCRVSPARMHMCAWFLNQGSAACRVGPLGCSRTRSAGSAAFMLQHCWIGSMNASIDGIRH